MHRHLLVAFLSLYLLFSFICPLGAQTNVFSQGVTVTTLAGPLASTPGDFNGDGHLDIAISNTAVSSVSILLGVGDGTFRTPVVYSTAGCQPGQAITGDFNRDGHLDLLASCTLTANVMVLPGRGDGTFGAPIFSKTPFPVVSGFLDGFVEPLTTADVNGDGILDLALIIQTVPSVGLTSAGAIGQAVVMLGEGNGTFAAPVTLNIAPTGTEPYAVQLADVNRDGKQDIVGIAFDYNASGLTDPPVAYVFVAIGNGLGGFQLEHQYPLTGIPQTGMMLGDINGDGKLDVVFAGLSIAAILDEDLNDLSGVGVFLGNGDGSFTPGFTTEDSQLAMNQATVGAALTPVLGTKYPDIIGLVIYSSLTDPPLVTGGVVVRPNHGDGTFGAAETVVSPSNASYPFSVSVGDFNGDGRPDLFTLDFKVNLLDLILSGPDITTQIDTIGGSISSFPAGTGSILLNKTAPTTITDTNAASFATGPLATSSIVSAFGAGLASSTMSASGLPLPTQLGGASILVTDSLGVARKAPMFYASPTQINYAIPDGTALNNATVAIATPNGTVTVQQPIVSVAPGVFDVSGVAIGQVFTYMNSVTPVITSTVSVSGQTFSPAPINVGSGSTSVYLILYGTGIRGHQTPVTATVGSTALSTAYAGAQGVYVGEDQINIQLPQSLKGAGTVNVTLNVDGKLTNPVTIAVQ